MNLSTSIKSNPLQITMWILIGITVFYPLLSLNNEFDVIQLVCLAALIAVQYKLGTHRKVILGMFSFAYILLASFWLIGL